MQEWTARASELSVLTCSLQKWRWKCKSIWIQVPKDFLRRLLQDREWNEKGDWEVFDSK